MSRVCKPRGLRPWVCAGTGTGWDLVTLMEPVPVTRVWRAVGTVHVTQPSRSHLPCPPPHLSNHPAHHRVATTDDPRRPRPLPRDPHNTQHTTPDAQRHRGACTDGDEGHVTAPNAGR